MTHLMKIIAQSALVAALAAAAVPASAETSVKASCTVRNADAALVSNYPVDTPDFAADHSLTATAVVEVDLDQNGKAHNASIVHSSGMRAVDIAARRSALAQEYTAEIRDCQSVPGSYIVNVTF